MTYQRSWSVLLLLLMLVVNVTGCGRQGMSKADRERMIRESLEEIETIKKDRSMSPQMKRDLIERAQVQLDDLRGGTPESN